MANEPTDRFTQAEVTVINNAGKDNESTETAQVTSPYHFVPLTPFAIATPWADGQPRLDKPHREGLSGELTVSWTAETPILVGGPGDNSRFFQPSGSDRIALPGSTLRGCIRALLEALTMARTNHIHRDATYSVRDLGGGNNNQWRTAREAMGLSGYAKPKGGWLTVKRDSNGAMVGELRQVDWEEIRTEAILAHFNAGRPTKISQAEFETAHVARKYELLGEAAFAQLAISHDGTHWKLGTPDAGAPARKGQLVLSGPDPKRAKKREAFFDLPDPAGKVIHISAEDIARFRFIHSQIARGNPADAPRGTLDFWEERQRTHPDTPIPVFWLHKDSSAGQLGSRNYPVGHVLSLARSMKMPHAWSVGDVLNRTRPEAEKLGALDFVEALFGHVPAQGADAKPADDKPRQSAWRGRVMFGDAPASPSSNWSEQRVGPVVTGSPRPSFAPFYLVSSDEAKRPGPVEWSDPDANLAGIKRYPVKRRQTGFVQPKEGNRTATSMTFAVPGNKDLSFEGRIKFHNLLPEELGALIYAIGFGAPGAEGVERHAIGRAKAQGYGRVAGRVTAAKIEANLGATLSWVPGDPVPADAAAWVDRFTGWLADAYGAATGQSGIAFADIPSVAALLSMQDPAWGAHHAGRLVYPGGATTGAAVAAEAVLKASVTIRKAARAKDAQARLPRYPVKD